MTPEQIQRDREFADKYAVDNYGGDTTPGSLVARDVKAGIEYGRANPIQPMASKSDEERAREYSDKHCPAITSDGQRYIDARKESYLAGMLDERAIQEDELIKRINQNLKLKAQLAKQESAVQGLVEALKHTWPGSTYAIDVNAFNRQALKAYEESRGSK